MHVRVSCVQAAVLLCSSMSHWSYEFVRVPCVQVAGTSGKVVLEGGSDDEGASTEAQGRAILDVLGMDKRNEVLASVYMVRSDITLPVRQVCMTPLPLLRFDVRASVRSVVGVAKVGQDCLSHEWRPMQHSVLCWPGLCLTVVLLWECWLR